jgi:hypothetical protein
MMKTLIEWVLDAGAGLAKTRERFARFAALCERHGVSVKAPMVFDAACLTRKRPEEREAFLDEWFRTFCCPEVG